MTKKYELTFFGGAGIRHPRWFETYEAAHEMALEVLAKLDNRAAHPAIIYGDDLGRDGCSVP